MSSPSNVHSGLIPKVALEDVPEFLKPTVKEVNPQWVKGNQPKDIAHVKIAKNARVLYADQPDKITKAVQAHELTHVYQNRLRQPMTSDPNDLKDKAPPNYDYGGWEGLLSAQSQGKTIRDFTNEQQGKMIQDYVELQTRMHDPYYSNPKANPAVQEYMLNQWDKANQALGPYLRQLVGQPKLDDPKGDIFNLEKLDLKPPPPPGPPPAALTGTAVPLPEMGGTSVYFNPPKGNGE